MTTPTQGTLIGVVLDLSDSMRASIRNSSGDQLSRIEGLSLAFRSVMEDASFLADNRATAEEIPFRMFIYGFGLRLASSPTWTNPIGDIFSILSNLREQVNYYKPLQPELESVWLNEIEHMLDQGQMEGNAKEELRLFVKEELKEQAIRAEQQRSIAKFQHWCAFASHHIDVFSTELLSTTRQRRTVFVLVPIVMGLRWILSCPLFIMAHLNKLFEAWLQRKLSMLQDNADKYASQLAERVASLTQRTLAKHHRKILEVVEQEIIQFFEEEAFKIVNSYGLKRSVGVGIQNIDRRKLENIYENIVEQIRMIMSSHTSVTWERSISLLKRVSKVLKIPHLRWDILKEKTVLCAHQVVWEIINPEIRSMAKELTKECFTRAVLINLIQRVKNRETTLSLAQIGDLIQASDQEQVNLRALPIFGASPMGLALTLTFNRLWREVHLPQNKGLHPVIVIISDGQPTDSDQVDIPSLADEIKKLGIPIICCYITHKNIGRPWILRRNPGWFWSDAARLMFSISSHVEEYPQLAEHLKESRFKLKEQAKLFIQPNDADYLRSFIEAVLLPIQRERRSLQKIEQKKFIS